jgi:hypothetical protein
MFGVKREDGTQSRDVSVGPMTATACTLIVGNQPPIGPSTLLVLVLVLV